MRVQGDEAEALAFLEALRTGGAEVSIGTIKDRGRHAEGVRRGADAGLPATDAATRGYRWPPSYLAERSAGGAVTTYASRVGRSGPKCDHERSVPGKWVKWSPSRKVAIRPEWFTS